MNSHGFWKAQLLYLHGNEAEASTFMLLAPGRCVQLSAHSRGGLGATLLCFDSLIDS